MMLSKAKKWLISICLLIPFILTLGFCFFVYKLHYLPHPTAKLIEEADVAVVFTGASGRIDEAVDLLKKGQIRKVFISGVGKDVKPREMAAIHKIATTTQSHVYLGHKANTTLENVQETKEWLQRKNIKKFFLFTSYYHMPRSYTLLHAAMPNAEIITWPVWYPEPTTLSQWLNKARIILLEYFKFLRTPFQAFQLSNLT